MRSILLAAILAAVLGGCGAASVTTPPAVTLKVGDCFDAPSGSVADAQERPCPEAHAGEVTALVTLPGDASATYPSTAVLNDFATAHCGPAFQAYAGLPFEQVPNLIADFLAPLADGWSRGDRTMVCYVTDPSGQSLMRSMRSSAP